MGKSPDDIAGEIKGLREESDQIVDELLRRANPTNVARGMTAAVAERASSVVGEATARVNVAATTVSRAADDMPGPIRQHPMATTYAAVGLLAGVAGFAVSWFSVMRRPTASDRARESMQEVLDRAGGTLYQYWQRVQGASRDLQDVRLVTARREEPGMVKRLLWIGMVSIMTALGSMLFKRISESAWRSTMHEPPPQK